MILHRRHRPQQRRKMSSAPSPQATRRHAPPPPTSRAAARYAASHYSKQVVPFIRTIFAALPQRAMRRSREAASCDAFAFEGWRALQRKAQRRRCPPQQVFAR